MEVRTKFQIIDVCLSTFLFTPLVVLFWHGLFGILDALILKDYPLMGPWIITILGVLLQIVISCIQSELESFVSQKPFEKQRKYIIAFNFVMATIQIMHFRGLNDIYEYFMGFGVYDAITATCTAIVLVCSSRVCTQLCDMPFSLSLDTEITPKEAFKLASYYQSEPGRKKHHVIDAAVTTVLVLTFVNLFNIAAWIAVDSSFFPSNAALATLSSWIFGHAITLGIIYLMPILKQLSNDALNSDTPIVGTAFLDVVVIVQGLGVVMSWHGHFVFFDVLRYYFPITHFGYDVTPVYEMIVAFCLLVLCHISSVLVRKGISSDLSDHSLGCLQFEANYFAHFFNAEIEEVEKEAAAKEEAEKLNEEDEMNRNIVKQVNLTKKISKSFNSEVDNLRKRKDVSLQDLVEIDRKKSENKKQS